MNEQRVIKKQSVKKLNEIMNHDLIYDNKIRVLAFQLYDDLSTAVVNLNTEKFDYVVSIHVNMYTTPIDHEVVVMVYERDQYIYGDDELLFQPISAEKFDIDKLFDCLVNSDFSHSDWCCN